jgi:16S rRNA (cytosine967-C5)-methyltransferase
MAKREVRYEGRSRKKADARTVALKALCAVVRDGAYASLALNAALEASALNPRDKRLCTSIFYTTLEKRMLIDYTLKQFIQKRPDDAAREILRMAVAQLLYMDKLPDYAVVSEALSQVRASGLEAQVPFINGVLRSILRAKEAGTLAFPKREDGELAYLSITHSLPMHLTERLVAQYGDEGEALIAYRPDEHIETVRANALKMDDAAFEKYLRVRAFEFERTCLSSAYALRDAGDLSRDPGFQDGLFSIQGLSSVIAAKALAPKRGGQYLDACAAPGGKSAYLAEQMQNTGRVQAWDVHPHRVELLRATQRRLGIETMRPMERDATVYRDELEKTFDGVLIDAPCSGLGVMFDKPDIKYRLNASDLEALAALQARLLSVCARYVAPGGRLVYSTCTLLREENQLQAEAFLRQNPDFRPDEDVSYLPEKLRPYAQGGMIQILPTRDEMEGFFIARMVRSCG